MKKNSLSLAAGAALLAAAGAVQAAELWIGAAQADITPDRPISLSGQFHNRISTNILSRCTANVLALESRENGKPSDCAILVSLDVVSLRDTQDEFKRYIAGRMPGFDTNKLFLAATHTHTGPTLAQTNFNNYGNAMQIQGRSPAGQTVLVQLASHTGTNGYLPSERAVAGGGYSAVPQSSQIGPEGGQVLVERTLAAIAALFKK